MIDFHEFAAGADSAFSRRTSARSNAASNLTSILSCPSASLRLDTSGSEAVVVDTLRAWLARAAARSRTTE